jgi:hypothetical protein
VEPEGEPSKFPRFSTSRPGAGRRASVLLVHPCGLRVSGHGSVSLTTTARSHLGQLLTTIDATSAATAQAARLAALAYARYPSLRPETVRGLLVHEAQWTAAMIEGAYNRKGRRRINAGRLARTVLRRYGWGVPTQERVLSSTASAVTMIIQGSLKPFIRDDTNKKTILGELKLHELPGLSQPPIDPGTIQWRRVPPSWRCCGRWAAGRAV